MTRIRETSQAVTGGDRRERSRGGRAVLAAWLVATVLGSYGGRASWCGEEGYPDLLLESPFRPCRSWNQGHRIFGQGHLDGSSRTELDICFGGGQAFGDIDGDGLVDEINESGVFLGHGDGVFGIMTVAFMNQNSSMAFASADLDKDGYDDVLMGTHGIKVYFGQADGTVRGGEEVLPYEAGDVPPVLKLLDIDQDGFEDVLRAFFFPNRFDNAAGGSRDNELGNQIGVIAIAANHRVGSVPLRLYWEMGADDTSSQRVIYFGNPLTTVGLFLPRVSSSISLRYEFSEGQNRWYEHAIYQNGYRNDGRIMGHWMYEPNRERWKYETEARLHSLRMVSTTDRHEISATLRVVSARSFSGIDFTTGVEADLGLRQALTARLDGEVRLYTGSTARSERFGLLSFGLSWH